MHNTEIRQELLKKPMQCAVFVGSVTRLASANLLVLLETKCSRGHLIFELLATKLFNLYSRNLLKHINKGFVQNTEALCKEKKIRKLQSKTAK